MFTTLLCVRNAKSNVWVIKMSFIASFLSVDASWATNKKCKDFRSIRKRAISFLAPLNNCFACISCVGMHSVRRLELEKEIQNADWSGLCAGCSLWFLLICFFLVFFVAISGSGFWILQGSKLKFKTWKTFVNWKQF